MGNRRSGPDYGKVQVLIAGRKQVRTAKPVMTSVTTCLQKNKKGRYPMRKIITTIVCMLTSLAAVNGAGAQQHAVRATIPFDFSAAGVELSAGTYTIATQNGLTSITKSGTRKAVFVRAKAATGALPDDSKLVFSINGDQHLLQKTLCPEVNMSLELLPSKPEMKVQ